MEEALNLIPIKQDFFTLLFWTASFLSFFISLIILYSSRLRSQVLILLSFVQFLMAALVFDLYLAHSGWMKKVLWYNDATEWMVISIGPGLYLLSLLLIKKKDLKLRQFLIHFAAPVAYFFYQFFYMFQPAEVKYNAYVGAFHPTLSLLPYSTSFSWDPLCLKENFERILLLSIVGYAIAGALMLYRNTSFPGPSTLLRSFSKYSFITWSLGSLFVNGISLFILFLYMEEEQSYIYVGGLLSIEILYLSGLIIVSSRVLSTKWVADKYDTSSLGTKTMADILKEVDQYVSTEAYFLNAKAGLQDLASHLNIPANHISQSINGVKGLNFSDYINSYRVNAAIELIQSEASEQLTMEGIGGQVGFSSKSAFYHAFKKATDQTPAQFRKSQ